MIASRALATTAVLFAVAAAAPPLAAQFAEKGRFELHADRTAYLPGAEVELAAVLRIDRGWHVNAFRPTFDYLIPTELELELPPGWADAEIAYPPAEHERFTFAEEELAVYQGEVVIRARTRVPEGAASGRVPLRAALTYQACDDTQCLPPVTTEQELGLAVGGGGRATAGPWFGGTAAEPAAATGPGNLLLILLLGLLGGLILNAMPCVLPVLSIKVFGLVQSAALSRRDVVTAGLATAAGILASFLALAGAAIAARAAGRAVGWGVQFQEPGFVAFLAVVVVLFSLNMWGLFEIQLPGRLAQLAGGGHHEGVAGHFASGLFATLMATPCSAPFLGTAVGFALAQPPGTILAVFTAVGLGMSLPYLALAAWPRAAGLLPRPGAWMVRLKEVMGFLLAGAAVWLFYVLAAQVTAERLAFVQLALLGLALAVWLRAAAARPMTGRLAMLAVVGTAAATLWLAATAPPKEASRLSGEAGGHVQWVDFDRAEAQRLAAAGTPVFVDVTADWCFTCKVNERLVLDTPEVAAAFATHGVVPMRADWTNRDEGIGSFLAEHGRYGIPFYVLYRPGAQPLVFSELLSRDSVLRALDEL